MIEALITKQEGGGWSVGDIICVKLEGSPWGTEEIITHQLVKFDDADLEAKLQARVDVGEVNPVISYPYVDQTFTAPTGKQRRPTIVVNQISSKYIDLTSIQSQPLIPSKNGKQISVDTATIPTVTLNDK